MTLSASPGFATLAADGGEHPHRLAHGGGGKTTRLPQAQRGLRSKISRRQPATGMKIALLCILLTAIFFAYTYFSRDRVPYVTPHTPAAVQQPCDMCPCPVCQKCPFPTNFGDTAEHGLKLSTAAVATIPRQSQQHPKQQSGNEAARASSSNSGARSLQGRHLHAVVGPGGSAEGEQAQCACETSAVACDKITLLQGPAMDRQAEDLVQVTAAYTLQVDDAYWDSASPATLSYRSVMLRLHGHDIWQEASLGATMEQLGVPASTRDDLYGSEMNNDVLTRLITRLRPKIIVEVGVFRGATSIKAARLLDSTPGLEESFVISIDTWLLDLRYVWSGSQAHAREVQNSRYFKNQYIGGASLMYFIFLQNVLLSQVSHRIIPLQSTSSNAAMALISHGVRPELVYIDASHANPDVMIDLENYFQILPQGGVMVMDDYHVPSVRAAVDAFVKAHRLRLHIKEQRVSSQAIVVKHHHREQPDDHDHFRDLPF